MVGLESDQRNSKVSYSVCAHRELQTFARETLRFLEAPDVGCEELQQNQRP